MNLGPIDLARWHPASGYRAKSGKSYWRIVYGHPRHVEYCDARGSIILFRSYDSAYRRATELNIAATRAEDRRFPPTPGLAAAVKRLGV